MEALLKEVDEILLQMSAEERAALIMNCYFSMAEAKMNSGEEIPERTWRLFTEWLLDPCDQEAKDLALEELFMRMATWEQPVVR